ncbi:hypothetical protein B0H17DRAFT_896397, partial [Mycena rosella]
LLLWVMNALSPQAIRDRIMSADSLFQKKLVAYLESCHQGEFIHGTLAEVQTRVKTDPHPSPEEEDAQSTVEYKVPTQTLPSVPPPLCTEDHESEGCEVCERMARWWLAYEHEVDDLWLRSNVHKCKESRRGCLSKTGICKARFPRDIYPVTTIDSDGHINMKKLEAYVNNMNRVLTYFARSNSDVTSLLSGTSVKAVVSYVADYVSKLGLKSYQAFASVHDV